MGKVKTHVCGQCVLALTNVPYINLIGIEPPTSNSMDDADWCTDSVGQLVAIAPHPSITDMNIHVNIKRCLITRHKE